MHCLGVDLGDVAQLTGGVAGRRRTNQLPVVLQVAGRQGADHLRPARPRQRGDRLNAAAALGDRTRCRRLVTIQGRLPGAQHSFHMFNGQHRRLLAWASLGARDDPPLARQQPDRRAPTLLAAGRSSRTV